MVIKFSPFAKLYLMIFITATGLIGLFLYGINDLKKMNDNTRSLYADRVLCMQQLANVHFEYTSEILPIAQKVKDHLFTFSEAERRIRKAEGIINTNWHAYKHTYLTPEEERLVRQTDAIKNQVDKSNENLESILTKEDAVALDWFIKKDFSTNQAPIIVKITQLMDLQVRVGKALYANNEQIFKSTTKKFILVTLLSLVISVSLSIYIIKNIKNLFKDILMKRNIIKESDKKHRMLIEQASDAIYLVDEKGNFTEVNESLCKMTGYAREEILKLNVEHLIDPEQLKTDPILHGYHQPDQSTIRERRFLRKDGTIFDVEINAKLFADNYTLVMAREVTDRKRMEAELREAEIKFRTLAEKSMVGIYIVQKGKFVYVNPRFAGIFGYEPDDLLDNVPVETIIHEDYRAIANENVRRRMANEVESVHYEVMGKKKDGTSNWVEFYGSRTVIGKEPTIIGTMIDVSDKKLSQDLILKEKHLSDAIINSLPGIFYVRNERGKFLRWNKNLENVTGYTAGEIETLVVRDMIAREDFETLDVAAEKAFKDGYAMAEAKVKTKDGTKIPFLLSGSPINYENQPCLIGTGIDILSRMKAEEELRLSEQKYKYLFDSNPSPLWMIAKDDLSIIAVNETAAKLYGYSKDELLQMGVNQLRPAEDAEDQLEVFKKEITDSTDIGIIRQIKKNGTVFYVQIITHDIIFEGRAIRLSMTNDVTKRLEAEESLKKSEANLQTILKTTDTAYALFDLELKALAFNQKAIEFVKHEYYHLPKKGDRLADFFPVERFPQFLNFTKAVLQGNNINYEIDYAQDDGSVVWYYVSLFPITNDNKVILGMMMSLYDITERKNAEEQLKTAYERIQSHLNRIKDMAWKQSHLIRSPLANLKGLAAMLKEDPSDADVLGFIQNELDRMDSIIIEMAEDVSRENIND